MKYFYIENKNNPTDFVIIKSENFLSMSSDDWNIRKISEEEFKENVTPH